MSATLRALTIRHPWAEATLRETHRKDVENRPWGTAYRGPLVIHAGLQLDHAGFRSLREEVTAEHERSAGHILGIVDLVDVHRAGRGQMGGCDEWECDANPWAEAPRLDGRLWHWRIEKPRPFVTPIRARGALGLWTMPPSIAHLVDIAEIRA